MWRKSGRRKKFEKNDKKPYLCGKILWKWRFSPQKSNDYPIKLEVNRIILPKQNEYRGRD